MCAAQWRSHSLLQWGTCLPATVRADLLQAGHDSWALFFFEHSIPFRCISSDSFKKAVAATASIAPGAFTPHNRQTLASSDLTRMDDAARAFDEHAIDTGMAYGFTMTGDGMSSSKAHKKAYHNFILGTVTGPLLLDMKDTTGKPCKAEDVCADFKEAINRLSPACQARLFFLFLDTPSVNRKAWQLLEKLFPHLMCGGCMSHEISLLMTDVCKLTYSRELIRDCSELYKWFVNHGTLLAIFNKHVESYYTHKQNALPQGDAAGRRRCASRKKMMLKKPGDTRMLSAFKTIFRNAIVLKPILVACFADAEYDAAAQKIMKAYNASTKKTANKYKKRRRGESDFKDPMKTLWGSSDAVGYANAAVWCQSTVAIVYLHRVVDTHAPTLHRVYYGCCLIDKFLRCLTDLDSNAAWLEEFSNLFAKRWGRWHRPYHTAAYAFNPEYFSHKLTLLEEQDVSITLRRLKGEADGEETYQAWKQLKANLARVPPGVLAAVGPAHEWWENNAHHLLFLNDPSKGGKDGRAELLQDAGRILCGQMSSASAAEQGEVGWSAVKTIETSLRGALLTGTTKKCLHVKGWQWALKERDLCKVSADIFDMLDQQVSDTQDLAAEQGLDEGADDAAAPEEEAAAEEDEAEAAAAPEEEAAEEEDAAASAGVWAEDLSDSEEDEAGYETDPDQPMTTVTKPRTAMKANQQLAACLPSLVSWTETNFESSTTRQLAYCT